MGRSRLGRLAEKVTDLPLARRVLGHVIDKGIEATISRLRAKLPRMLEILGDEDLLRLTEGEDSDSEVLLRELGESHMQAGVAMLQIIRETEDYRSMVAAVVDGFEGCQREEAEYDIEAAIRTLNDPLARALMRAFVFQRDYYLEFLKFLQAEGLDDLNGIGLYASLPEMVDRFRQVQSDMLHDLVEKEPNGVVADAIRAIIALKRAGRE